jgi:acyl-CoA thioesterase FadM
VYPIVRGISTFIKAKQAKPLPFDGISKISFICRPWDIDMFMEMNNGRILTLYDLGRFDLAIRGGLMKTLKANNWGLVVAGSTTRYRKRVRMFDKVTMHTQMTGFDERWIYISQSMWVKGEPCSSVLLRTGITKKGKVINPKHIEEAMDLTDISFPHSDFLEEWIISEKDRPWPPKP